TKKGLNLAFLSKSAYMQLSVFRNALCQVTLEQVNNQQYNSNMGVSYKLRHSHISISANIT
ncbi:hypothetical protein, partial [Secundilactobacillus paracollinoides]|uniref:hypothetical protein n=1 Tax=Secundilactobacillus paracollinoides TaxID=240427 RepID=UPI000A57702E